MGVSRRELFGCAAMGVAAGVLGAPGATAADLGMLVDYAGGVPSAAAIRAAGYAGAIRYVSDRRPGAQWMVGKPLLPDEATALRSAGLQVVSCYQYGKGPTADWRGGREAGRKHARRALELHRAAGGPPNRPIYASVDDNPNRAQFDRLIAPYLLGWHEVLGRARTGVYANAPTLDWAIEVGLGAWYWQHNWGSAGRQHPDAHLHQVGKRQVAGIPVDINIIRKPDYGQW